MKKNCVTIESVPVVRTGISITDEPWPLRRWWCRCVYYATTAGGIGLRLKRKTKNMRPRENENGTGPKDNPAARSGWLRCFVTDYWTRAENFRTEPFNQRWTVNLVEPKREHYATAFWPFARCEVRSTVQHGYTW